MLRKQVLNTWTNLKEKLSTVQYLHQHKPLIIEALEFHLNQASSFTSEYTNPPLLNRRLMEQQKARLTKDLELWPNTTLKKSKNYLPMLLLYE